MANTTTISKKAPRITPAGEAAMGVLNKKLTRQLAVSLQACVHCGRCFETCHYFLATRDPEMTPAIKAEKLRALYKRRYDWMGRVFPAWVNGKEPTESQLEALYDTAWGSCTMCRRCTMTCPMGVDMGLVMRVARSMLSSQGRTPKGLQDTVATHLKSGNNMGISREDFLDTVQWIEEELQSEVGDKGAKIAVDKVGANIMLTLNPREVKFYPLLFLAQAKILYAAGEDWTLSSEAWDATNYALFSGDDNAARQIVERVVNEAERLKVNTIAMTECGHGYRAMRWEACNWLGRQIGVGCKGFTEVVAEYIKEGRLELNPAVNTQLVTYHDPCNQARSGGIIEEPRYVLRHAVMDFREMTPNREHNFCCGGGGGALTMSEFAKRRLEAARIKAEQIKATGATIVATSCHNCIDQLNELAKYYQLKVQVKNTCELVAEALVLRRKAIEKPSPFDLNEQGYLKEPSSWDREVAQLLASTQGVGELGKKHWQILEYVRDYYSHYQAWPLPQRVKKDLGVDPRQLFPGSPEVVFKVAGIPAPEEGIRWEGRSLWQHS